MIVLNFIGIGSAWNVNQNNTSAFIKLDGKMVLIDCGETTARYIIENDILNDVKELFILISHTHSDHIGSLGTLLFYSKYEKRINNYIPLPNDKEYQDNLQSYLNLVDIHDEVSLIDADTFKKSLCLRRFDFLKATHSKSLPCYSFIFEDENSKVYYSGDNSDIEYILNYLKSQDTYIFTEVSNNPAVANEHLYLQRLLDNTSFEERKKIYLMHLDNYTNIKDLKEMGFNVPNVIRKREK